MEKEGFAAFAHFTASPSIGLLFHNLKITILDAWQKSDFSGLLVCPYKFEIKHTLWLFQATRTEILEN